LDQQTAARQEIIFAPDGPEIGSLEEQALVIPTS